ncbi:uncharacterized protein BYT42DRAFT_550841 [Radiomyces spectabilis]|uniref:uncharacterized protein n=1 Tax=Radiomyces spectabilis TaxID=64574 RepID=UPI00221F076C|nr:uncharacterized protein BYT42DRAFT_550841 [Radiomyces spectabilis]KAI8393386.1 hypothetical protein BYT42DRAFT_550841 [Radiomyces spectabilis]
MVSTFFLFFFFVVCLSSIILRRCLPYAVSMVSPLVCLPFPSWFLLVASPWSPVNFLWLALI